jgi:hypothetical protein
MRACPAESFPKIRNRPLVNLAEAIIIVAVANDGALGRSRLRVDVRGNEFLPALRCAGEVALFALRRIVVDRICACDGKAERREEATEA